MTTVGFMWYEMVTIEGSLQVFGYEVFAASEFWTCGIIVFGEIAEYPAQLSVVLG